MDKKLDPWALAASLGFTWMIGIVFLGVAAGLGWGEDLIPLISSIYLGFDTSAVGIVLGAIWAFVDGVIAGALLALFYNFFSGKLEK